MFFRRSPWVLPKTPGRLVAAAMVALMIPTSAGFAADDGGLGEFFREQFGIGGSQAVQPQQEYDIPEDRPLIVRPHRSRAITRRPQAKVAVGPVAPVSIYQDTTLRAGDAVMTSKGIRVFLGGHSAPYTEADFAALPDAEGLPRQIGKALAAIDKAPRG
ncbi:hypothetical protein [Lichenifustis flavocetrariae]|uniref:Uncharacterized protein n=1 Tax=Lichenifustis flavocetrariae TaxID=2949735 RepID=A0AA41Z5U4_9HYPH|nr:hypothetical protein [Lichenifustis flavocetrariae]MCW6511048.1 hypothetical protein [Lichenifustis flavocetrariae]